MRSNSEQCPLCRIRRSSAGSLRLEERFELGDGAQWPKRVAASARQHVGWADLTLGYGTLQIAERRVDELTPRAFADNPALRRAAAAAREDLELMAAVRALDRRATLGNERVVEVVFGATATAADVHLANVPEEIGRQI